MHSCHEIILALMLFLPCGSKAKRRERPVRYHLSKIARHCENIKKIKRYLDKLNRLGKNIDQQDAKGRTGLHEALYESHYSFAIALVQAGADPYKADNQGKTPIDDAKENRRNNFALQMADERRKYIAEHNEHKEE